MINAEKKKLLRERREKAIQNTRDREKAKVNAQAALQVDIGESKASKINEDIRMTDNAAEYEDNSDEKYLFSSLPAKAKGSSQINTSLRCKTAHTKPSLGDPLPGSQATTDVKGHKPGLGNIGKY